MKIFTFSQQGKRSNNEDYTGHNERLWMVCDGVGGHVSGERASKFVVQTMLEYFQQDIPELNKNRIQECMVEVQTELNSILDTEPELEKMGTTFTGIFKTDAFWYAAHLGDSRIYLYRPKEKKLWHTWDHSLVGELMKNKEITLEDGRHHPLSNRIQKAMIANFEGKTNTPDIVKIDNLQPGDIFMLCSDGVIEAWSDFELVNLFSDEQLSFEEKGNKLQEQCEQLSKDNNTALLLEVEDTDAFSYGNGKNEELRWTSFQDIQDDYQEYLGKQKEDEAEVEAVELDVEAENLTESQDNVPVTALNEDNCPSIFPKTGKKQWVIILIAAILLFIGAAAGILFERYHNNTKTKPHQTEKTHKKIESASKTNGNKTEKEPEKEEDAKILKKLQSVISKDRQGDNKGSNNKDLSDETTDQK